MFDPKAVKVGFVLVIKVALGLSLSEQFLVSLSFHQMSVLFLASSWKWSRGPVEAADPQRHDLTPSRRKTPLGVNFVEYCKRGGGGGGVLTPATVSVALPFFRNLDSESNMRLHAGGPFSDIKEDRM